MPNTEILRINWTDYINDCMEFSELIIKEDLGDIPIISISRGGFIPSLISSHKTNNRKIQTMSVLSYDDTLDIKDRHTEISIDQEPDIYYPTVLVIDDLVDSGNTMKFVVKYLESRVNMIYTAVVYNKNPDFNLKVVYKNIDPKKWIIFPYESE